MSLHRCTPTTHEIYTDYTDPMIVNLKYIKINLNLYTSMYTSLLHLTYIKDRKLSVPDALFHFSYWFFYFSLLY